jgi:hypothetical protein
MADRLVIDVFCEDSGHETFLRNLIKVLANTVSIPNPELHIHSARGGHGSALNSLKAGSERFEMVINPMAMPC